jgi:membrane fusion protein (multidrug efflux system)
MKMHFSTLALGLITLTLSCSSPQEKAPQQARPVQVPSVKVVKKSVQAFKSYPASVEGVVNSEVRAKVSGYITDVLVDEGQVVKKGEVLFKLETQALTQDAGAAKAAVNAAQVEVDKLIPLVEKGIISSVQLETAKANLARAKSSYNSVAANIDYGSIKSPVDGVVGTLNFRKGSLVGPADQRALTTVSSIEQVYAFFSMNEKEYLDFLQNTKGNTLTERIGNISPVSLVLANGSLYEVKGKIETASGQIDPNTGTVSFRAIFENPKQLLTNGNSGTIRIPLAYTDALVVPTMSTFEQQGSRFVYRISKEGTAVSRKIEVQQEVKDLVVLSSGLEEGDEIVAKGVAKIKNNTAVEAKEIPLDSVATFEPVFK